MQGTNERGELRSEIQRILGYESKAKFELREENETCIDQ
jgi:hypothetical protein